MIARIAPWHRALIATAMVLAMATACTDDAPKATATTTSEPTDTPAPAVESFSGDVEDFYDVPSPLPAVDHGTLLRTQAAGSDDQTRNMRIMYRSDDAASRPRAVTGTVTIPAGEPPEGGWPIIAVAPGTVGLASQCALSRTGAPVPDLGVPAIRVMTDYIGMGPVGETMPYLSRVSEANSVLDSVLAVRQLVGGDASEQVVIFGHSQGGHGAQAAHELAGERIPEFDVVGTVSVAPAAMFAKTYGGIDDIVSRIVTTMSLEGISTERDDLDLADYVRPDVADAAAEVLATECLETVITTLAPFAAGADYWSADPVVTEPAASIMQENDVGNTRADAPLLLIGGTADDRVVAQRVFDLRDRLCESGQVTRFVMLDGADHATEIPQALPQISAWILDRLDGRPAVDDCP